MLRSAQILLVVTSAVLLTSFPSELVAQEGRAAVNPSQPAAQPAAQMDPKLVDILVRWSRASDQINTLHGTHTRRVYDSTFGTEKISTGEVWFNAPDKGRIDIKAVEISKKMLAARQAKDAMVQRDSEGNPYSLISDHEGKWICDGERVFDIKDKEKRANVAILPPTLRGKAIMDSPLPFLFGMPPEKAAKRYHLEVVRDYRPERTYFKFKATPRLPQDARNWSQAEIILNTKTYLPASVKLLDPGKKSSKVYTFEKIEVNKKSILDFFTRSNPWKPDLRGYSINAIGNQENTGDQPNQMVNGQRTDPRRQNMAQANGQGKSSITPIAQVAVVPNVIGKNYSDAIQALMNAGVPETLISIRKGGTPRRKEDEYKVRDQLPKPGTPLGTFLQSKKKFALAVFEEHH